MELKDFQRNALDTLTAYLERTRSTNDPEQAFIQILRESNPDVNPPSYRIIANLAGVPNVCLRLPTGGGKTLLAAHTISVAGRSFLERDYPVVLWLVPTGTIRKQTAEALKKPFHPYRAAIDNAFAGRVSVFDISEIDQIRPQDLTDRVTVIACARAIQTAARLMPIQKTMNRTSPIFTLKHKGLTGMIKATSSFLSSTLWRFTVPLSSLMKPIKQEPTCLSICWLPCTRPAS